MAERVTVKSLGAMAMRHRTLCVAGLAVALAGCRSTPVLTIAPESLASPTPASALGAIMTTVEAQASAMPTSCALPATPAQTEGPYFKPGSPERANLAEEDPAGTPLLVTGTVMTTSCAPLAEVRIEFWQADSSGAYDNAGFRLRGHQFSDSQGNYRLETVIPGQYSGRTPHIHVKILARDGMELLTTQIYLTGLSELTPDGIFDPQLLAVDEPPEADGRRHVSFDFVVSP